MSIRLYIANHLMTVILVIGVPCLIVAKLHILPRTVNKIALWGLGVCFLLILLRLSLLAFGD
jgi:hypothetical protein